jgi:hypothetical protein
MEKDKIIEQLQQKYNEIFPKYWNIVMKKIEEPYNKEIEKIYNYLNINIKYIEKYIILLKDDETDNIEKYIDELNMIKQINDALYEPKEDTKYQTNSKVEILIE